MAKPPVNQLPLWLHVPHVLPAHIVVAVELFYVKVANFHLEVKVLALNVLHDLSALQVLLLLALVQQEGMYWSFTIVEMFCLLNTCTCSHQFHIPNNFYFCSFILVILMPELVGVLIVLVEAIVLVELAVFVLLEPLPLFLAQVLVVNALQARSV